MFSMVTVASSTRMPTARARPPRVMMLMVSWSRLRTMTELRIESGMETAMMRVLRQLPRNIRIMMPVRQAAMTASRMTPLTALRTKTDWSARGRIFNSGGRVCATRGRRVRTPFTTSRVEALPALRVVGNSTIYLRDVANVRDGFAPQTNIARQDGNRGVLVSILKAGNASTLDVVKGVRTLLPRVAQTLPPELKIRPLADQSVFVRSAVSGVIREAVIAACLTGIMILIFLGSWRSTLIIAVSIPLSILSSVIVLSLLHETINIMTLGGLALAVGILVDDATVTIENIERYFEEGHAKREAILDGAAQIAVPALVSTLCICIVFMPMFLLSGVARYLFVPLAEPVVFAMLASYILSRTVAPTLAIYPLNEHGY